MDTLYYVTPSYQKTLDTAPTFTTQSDAEAYAQSASETLGGSYVVWKVEAVYTH